MTPTTMKAAVIREPGAPEVLVIEELPVPQPAPGWILIRVKAFGLNRSELFTRQGLSPSVSFPRVLGIEAVGVVENAPGGEFKPGQIVATAMGGMGRAFDGGYAEYTSVQVFDGNDIWTVLAEAVKDELNESENFLIKIIDSFALLQNTSQEMQETIILSPIKQLKSGILPLDIECKKGLNLIFKISDGSPACVKPETKEKLIERGWART